MDIEAGKEISLIEAQKIIKNCSEIFVGTTTPDGTKAVKDVICAIQLHGYHLIKLEKLMDGINKKAIEGISMDADKADIYMSCLEELTALIKDCLE